MLQFCRIDLCSYDIVSVQVLLLHAKMLAIMVAVAALVHAEPHLDATVTVHVIPLKTVVLTSEI